jgi:peptidoglycan hydrolase-like protein with peptidoglycan-binding domain
MPGLIQRGGLWGGSRWGALRGGAFRGGLRGGFRGGFHRGGRFGRGPRWHGIFGAVPFAPPTPDPQVMSAQACLAQVVDPAVPQDGLLGPQTRQALRTFQTQQQLPVTGSLDPNTSSALQTACSPPPPPPPPQDQAQQPPPPQGGAPPAPGGQGGRSRQHEAESFEGEEGEFPFERRFFRPEFRPEFRREGFRGEPFREPFRGGLFREERWRENRLAPPFFEAEAAPAGVEQREFPFERRFFRPEGVFRAEERRREEPWREHRRWPWLLAEGENEAGYEYEAHGVVLPSLASATEDFSLKDLADGKIGNVPKEFLKAILTDGDNDADNLTYRVFWHVFHPEMLGKTLDPKDPKQKALRDEWTRIRNRQVKPLIWLRQVIDQLDVHRGTLPRDFLLGWMAVESDGQVTSLTSRGERGYFQVDWIGGEAKEQLGLSKEEFNRLTTDRNFSIKEGVELADRYRQFILSHFSQVGDGTELSLRLTKGRHAASGTLSAALNKLVKSGQPITWPAVSGAIPSGMVDNIEHTMHFGERLRRFADLVPDAAVQPEFEGEIFRAPLFRPRFAIRPEERVLERFPAERRGILERDRRLFPFGRGRRDWFLAAPGERPQIQWAQSCLAGQLGPEVLQDGVMGPNTHWAIRTFQEQRQLPVTGVLDGDTVGALEAACG